MKKAGLPKGFDKRMRIWNHNAQLGHCKRAILFCERVNKMDSTTLASKTQAGMALLALVPLYESLKTRIDPAS